MMKEQFVVSATDVVGVAILNNFLKKYAMWTSYI
jgi:hypothetical protein